jgi:pyridoxamine 5'-phosphate oxidase
MSEPSDPIARFNRDLEQAKKIEAHDATAMSLATADASGAPSVRMVLLKGVERGGFVFHTNYESRKGRELLENPRAALCFYWPALVEQVRVEGAVERVDDAESDAYFATRARGSQLGAWASRQSARVGSREDLDEAVREMDRRFPDLVPRPPFWGGYRLVPVRIEFWHGRESRLHDRFSYERDGDGWRVERLSP